MGASKVSHALDTRSWILGQIHVYCYMVSRGKPAASIMVPKELADDVLHEIEERGFGCKGLMDDGRDDDWRDI